MAQDVSSLVVFDYLQANTDRWQEDNVRLDEAGRLVYRDNSETWRDGLMSSLASGGRWLHFAQRFSRALVERLRRLAALRYIDALIARHGEARVLAFP